MGGFLCMGGFLLYGDSYFGRVSVIWEGFCGMGVSAVWGDFYAILERGKVKIRGFTPWV
jgi:hypothetical protein